VDADDEEGRAGERRRILFPVGHEVIQARRERPGERHVKEVGREEATKPRVEVLLREVIEVLFCREAEAHHRSADEYVELVTPFPQDRQERKEEQELRGFLT